MAISATKFQAFIGYVCNKKIDMSADTFKGMLTLNAPLATNSVKADLTEIAAGNGYAAGGTSITITTAAESGGTYTLAGNQVVYTASGGAIANFRYFVVYDDTPAAAPADPLMAFWDYGSTVTLNDTDTFTVKFNSANPGTIATAT